MSVTLEVDPTVLRAAKTMWDQASDELVAWRRLANASTDGFSPKVAAAVDAFREPWITQIKTAAQDASETSDAIRLTLLYVQMSDRDAAKQVRSMLPYVYRNATIRDI